MIELLTANTPNGKKISIMLEEINFKYKVTKINLNKDEQFKPEFKKISPFSKIPVIIDHDKNLSLFESGAILIYLGEKSGKFYDQNHIHLDLFSQLRKNEILYLINDSLGEWLLFLIDKVLHNLNNQ